MSQSLPKKPEYRGLVNEGSTCYLNSLLQTLFMTPQFRQNAYNYVHDQRKISANDSIPYQLQKLFVLLQVNQGSVYTNGLLKSFQWNQVDSFQQHDVQQFCRVLFQALQKASKGENWIQKMYSGVMQSYISCGQHPRSNQQVFMDLSLPIKNQLTLTCYKTIEQCLKQYLRPQTIDQVNCDGCGSKVKVQKGMRFINLPPILTLQVNRFQLNYDNMQRQKINTFLYFPQILQMGRFIGPFQQIEMKGMPKDLLDKVVFTEREKSARQTDWGIGGLTVTGKGIERKKSFQVQAEKKQTKFYDEENKDKRQDQTKKLSAQEEKVRNIQILKDLKADKQKLDKRTNSKKSQDKKQQTQKVTKQVMNQSKQQKIKQANAKPSTLSKAPPANSLEDDMLFGSFMDGFDRTGQSNLNEFDDIVIESSKKGVPKFQKTQPHFTHTQQTFDPNKQYPKNTYVLYSILVHSGGAYGGHYYAYIFNGIDWFCFNDNNVRKVSREQIRKYGHPAQQSSYGANAYLLFYREASTFKNLVGKQVIKIPEELLQKVRNDKTQTNDPLKVSHDTETIKTRFNQLQNGLVLKIKYKCDKNNLCTLIIPDRHSQTIKSLKELIRTNLNIEEDDANWRIRRYNKSEDTMHEIYDTKENLDKNLQQFGLRQTCQMAIQTKDAQQQFEDYDPKNITIKLNVWRNDLTLLTETHLRPVKLGIRQEKSFAQFYEKVKNILHLRNPLIIKRNFSVGNPYQIYTLQANAEKSLLSLRFFNGINLYVEENDSDKPKWQKEFQDEKYKCQVRFNNPREGYQKNYEIFIDTRKTLGELKQKISQIISIGVDEFRMKKSQQAVSQMTAYKKRLTDLKFVNVQYMHIEQGKSSKGTVIVRKGIASVIDEQIDFSLGQEFQLQIEGNVSTVADLKNKLGQKYGIPEFNIRVRQYKATQFGEIYRDSENLIKIREKSLVWQQLQIEDPKGLQLYIRVFNVMTLQLGPLLSCFVEASGNYEQLSLIIQEQTIIPSDKILVHKPVSNFVDRSLLFDCDWHEIRFLSRAIRDQPLFLTTDGEILIVKESQAAYHPKPSNKLTSGDSKNTVGQSKNTNKERGLKITVVAEKEQEPQQIKQTTVGNNETSSQSQVKNNNQTLTESKDNDNDKQQLL